jgi:uncharacterized protein (DUF1499 family)
MSIELPAGCNRPETGRLVCEKTAKAEDAAFGRPQLLVPLGLFLLFVSAAGSMLAPFGSRWGWWPFSAAVEVLRWSAIGALASTALLTLALVLRRRGRLLAVFGILIGLAIAAIPWSWEYRLKTLPAIHDVSTDTRNVPRFVVIAPLRKRCANGSHYSGPRAAAAQARVYPDIKPLLLPLSPARAFDRALTAARKMGWMIVDANAASRRIEATASTFWFGFKDDIVVRIAAAPQGSRIDVRSASRVGTGDGGTNAARIRSYLRTVASP